MTGMVTYAGLDVHTRSTHAAAIDVSTGELLRARFGPGVEEPVAWLQGLPGPVRACYEAGPTGFGLYRAASAAGVAVEVIAPGKILLARLLLAGSLTTVVVPPVEVKAARELMRAHDACRRDLMTARHRVSKMLLRHGRVYPESSTWTVAHRRWLAAQQFQETASELVFADLIASVDGLSARKTAIAERLSRLAQDEAWWPTVARLRCFRGVDTLTAFALHLELGGDWQRFARANALSAWLGLIPSLHQSGESSTKDRSPRRDRASLAGCSSRQPGTTGETRGSG
jgi:transposase